MDSLDRKLIGQKILKLRQRRGLTQKQVANLAGLSESALRSYELGDRNPKDKHLEKIAHALEVSPASLKDFGIVTNEQTAQALFHLQGQDRLEPQIIDGKPCLVPPFKNEPMRKLLRDWAKKENQFLNKEITAEDYEEWKDAYSFGTNINREQA